MGKNRMKKADIKKTTEHTKGSRQMLQKNGECWQAAECSLSLCAIQSAYFFARQYMDMLGTLCIK